MNPTISNLPLRNLPTSIEEKQTVSSPQREVNPTRPAVAVKVRVIRYTIPNNSVGQTVLTANPLRVQAVLRTNVATGLLWIGGAKTSDDCAQGGLTKNGLPLEGKEAYTHPTTDELTVANDGAAGFAANTVLYVLEYIAPTIQKQ